MRTDHTMQGYDQPPGWGNGTPPRRARRGAGACCIRRGFSLVELASVVFVMTVIGAIAFPRFARAHAGHGVDLFEARLRADLRLAQAEARSRGTAVAIKFDARSETYTIASQRSLDGGTVDVSASPYRLDLAAIDAATSVTWSFDGYGGFDGGWLQVVRGGSLTTFAVRYTSGAPVQVVRVDSEAVADQVVARPVVQ